MNVDGKGVVGNPAVGKPVVVMDDPEDDSDLESIDSNDSGSGDAVRKQLKKIRESLSVKKRKLEGHAWRKDLKDWNKLLRSICENSGVSDQLEKIMVSKSDKINAEKIFGKGNIYLRVNGLASIVAVGVIFYLAAKSTKKDPLVYHALEGELEEFMKLVSGDMLKNFDEKVIEVIRSAYKRFRKAVSGGFIHHYRAAKNDGLLGQEKAELLWKKRGGKNDNKFKKRKNFNPSRDSVKVCRAFNNGFCRYGEGCRFRHACFLCLGTHPKVNCINNRGNNAGNNNNNNNA